MTKSTTSNGSALCNHFPCGVAKGSPADVLNNSCFCVTLDREQLNKILSEDDLTKNVVQHYPQLFSNTTVFISSRQLEQMRSLIYAVERVVHLPAYQSHVLTRADEAASVGRDIVDMDVANMDIGMNSANVDTASAGVCMGYDFHLSASGPQVIEINTNAGGAFLNAALMRAQTVCCRTTEIFSSPLKTDIDDQFIAMFLNEWRLVNGTLPLSRIAIVDENPQQQFLYPEFKMARRLFERNGIATLIVDSSELEFSNNELTVKGEKIDMVYNRLTDFSLACPQNAALRAAYVAGAAVVTPNPRHHMLYASKYNLALFSDPQALKNIGASLADIATLQTFVPPTQIVTAENAESLWQTRKQLFFKPATGFGSKAAYRGDKVTKRVWQEILQGNYVAQNTVPPSERGILIDGRETALKMDIRAYVYAGEIQSLAARLYQGQTTNFRTQGGGFAPVFVAD